MKRAFLGILMAIHMVWLCHAADDRKSMESLPAQEQANIHREIKEALKLINEGKSQSGLDIVKPVTDRVRCYQAEVALGSAYTQLRQFKEGQEAFQRALDIYPGLYEARFNLAEIEFVSGRFAKALDGFRSLEGKRKDAHEILVHYKTFLCLLKLEQEAQAKERYLKMPKDTSLYRFSHAAVQFSRGNARHGLLSTKAAMEGTKSPQELNFFLDSFVELGWIEVDENGVTRAGSGKMKGPAAPPVDKES